MRGWGHEHVPQTFGARLLLQVLDHRDHLPALALGVLLLVDRHRGAHVLRHERLHAIEPFLLAVRHIEVHGGFLGWFIEIVAGTLCRRGFVGKAKHAAVRGAPLRALTFPSSNDSFIQWFELQAAPQRRYEMPTDRTRSAIL